MATTLKGAERKTLQDALLDAIDYMTTAKMDKLTLDKTVVATIVKNEDLLKNTYRIRYQGNENLVARAQSGDTYKKGQQVYVLVPQNDLSNDKIILGTASVDNASSEAGFISSVMNDYTYSGENAFLSSPTVFGLRSARIAGQQNKKDSELVYGSADFLEQAGDRVSPYIINTRFGQSAKNSEKIMLKAEFRTSLPSHHRMPNCGGEYGLKVVLSFNTNDVDYYYVLGKDNKHVKEHDGIPYTALDKDVKTAYKKRYQLYTLESSSSAFTGQPFNYPSFTEQYAIFDFDAKNFNAVESVVVYCQGFPLKEGESEAENIFIRNVQIYGLSRITAVQGDYSLRLNPATLVFSKSDGNNAEEDREVSTRADFRKKSLSLSSDVRMKFVWGAEDKTITSVSDGYNGYLGSGWKEIKNVGNSAYFSTKESDNLAYENKYKCSAIYSGDDDTKVILVQEFIVYNMNSKRDIEITSNLGTEFAFDNGTPTLTCSVKDDEGNSLLENSENEYIFVWSITTEEGTSRQIYSEQEAQKKVDDIQASLNQTGSPVKYADYAQAKNDRALASGVKYGTDANGNEARYILTLPISSVASSATVYCTVYQKEKGNDDSHNIGTASITLKNSKSVEVARYHIIIENGTQSFQYSEIGISPCDEEYNGLDYQEILPLTCHFYDPQGLEVPASEYVIQWSVPTSDSFFTTDGLNLSYKNPADDTGEQVSNSQVLTFNIQKRWRYAYTNRQITAIVTYQGEEFRKDTEFLFAKIGDNGTNGTDYVVKIVPKDNHFYPLPNSKGDEKYYENSYLPAFYLHAGTKPSEKENKFLNDTPFYSPPLTAMLYQRGAKVTDYKDFTWSIAKSGGHHSVAPLQVSSGTLSKIGNREDGTSLLPNEGTYYKGQIIKVSAKVNTSTDGDNKQYWDTIYGFYPMPIIRSYDRYVVSLNKTYTMQQILYNSDGKFPQYDTDQGFKIDGIFKGNDDDTKFTPVDGSEYTVTASCYGGVLENSATSNLASCTVLEGQDDTAPLFRRYLVTPHETYSGQYQNNGIYLEVKDKNQNLVCEVWIPIYMSLNRYALASLNKWDGNSIEIKDGEGKRSYILAPQIGAGIKNDDNSFTGVVMGSRFESTEDAEGNVKEQNDVGLFGYHKGKQSIFLDSKTGNAVFGLPEEQADEGNGNYEGRIVLTPGGKSTIANLTLASNAIYGASKLKGGDDGYKWFPFGEEDGQIKDGDYYWPSEDNKYMQVKRYDGKANITYFGTNGDPDGEKYRSFFEFDRDLNPEPYKQYPVGGSRMSIPSDEEGIIVSSFPAYLSIKGHPLTRYNSNILFGNGNTSIVEGDSFEFEVDPGKSEFFTIYRHCKENGQWVRKPRVGIDAAGNFYTNALRDTETKTSMNINNIGAFNWFVTDEGANNPKYIGVNFSHDYNTIIKIFKATSGEDQDQNVYFTTGTFPKVNEYEKGISVNVKTFSAYVSDGACVDTTTPHKFILKQNENFFGTEKDTFLNMVHNGSNSTIELQKRVYDEKDEKKFNSYGLNVSVDGTDGSTSLLNGPEQFLNFTSAEGKTILKAGNSLLNLTLTDEKSFLKIQPDSAILQIQKTEGKTTETSNLVLSHDSFTAKINPKGEFLKIDKDSSRFSHKYKDGSKEYESYLLLNTDDGITMETPSNLLVHAEKKAYFYTTGYESKDETLKRNYIKMEGDIFDLHSQRGNMFSLYQVTEFENKDKNRVLKFTSSAFSNDVTILGEMEPEDLAQQTGVNKGLCFPNADNGLVIERYQKQDGEGEENLLTSNMYVLRRNSKKDLNHALRVKGNVLIEGALKATESLATKSLSSDYLRSKIVDVTDHLGFIAPDGSENHALVNWGWVKNRESVVTQITANGNTLSWSGENISGGSFTFTSTKYSLHKLSVNFPRQVLSTSITDIRTALNALIVACEAGYNSLRLE